VRLLLISGLICLATLAVACVDKEDQEAVSPTAVPTISPTAVPTGSPVSGDDVIAFAQEYQAFEKAEGATWEFTVVPLASRVAKLCQDSPRWSAEEQQGIWRVFAECNKEESIPAENPLRFVWLFHPDSGEVMPVSLAAHVAQYSYAWR